MERKMGLKQMLEIGLRKIYRLSLLQITKVMFNSQKIIR